MQSYTSKKGCEHGPRKTVPKQKIPSDGFSFALRISITHPAGGMGTAQAFLAVEMPYHDVQIAFPSCHMTAMISRVR